MITMSLKVSAASCAEATSAKRLPTRICLPKTLILTPKRSTLLAPPEVRGWRIETTLRGNVRVRDMVQDS